MSVTEAFAASKSKEESNSNSKKKQNHWSSPEPSKISHYQAVR